MTDGCVLGFDLGGGGGRCMLVECRTGRTVTAFRAWRSTCTPGSSGLGFDFDLEELFARLVEACAETIARAGVRPADVLGIGACAMREGTVVLDGNGAALLATPNRDARAAVEAIELASEYGDHIYARCGHWPYPIFPAARLLWMKKQQPELFARAAVHLSLSDWLAWRLCGEVAAEPTQAGETLLFDLSTRDWAEDLIAELGLPRALFPPLADPGTRLGSLTPEAAGALGLPPGIAVAVGGADSQCAMLGAGATTAGDAVAITGTTAPVLLVTDRPLVDETQRLWSGHHAVPGCWVLESNGGPMGEVVDWFSRLLYPDAAAPIDRLFAEAEQSEPGAGGMLSTLGVQVWDARAMGVAVGNLTLSHMLSADDRAPRPHLARAVIEGFAFGVRANLDQLRAVADQDIAVLRLAGGLSRSSTWATLVANAIDRPVDGCASSEASALGAAMCATVAAGVFPELTIASAALAGTPTRHEATPERAARTAELYRNWNTLRHARVGADAIAGDLTTPWVLAAYDAAAAPQRSMIRPRILVTADMDRQSLASLERLGEVEYASFRDRMRLLTGPSLVDALQGCQVLITEVDVVDAKAIAELPDLRVLATCRGDAVNVSVDACTAYGIPVLHAPGRNAIAVADLTVAFALMLARKLQAATAFLHDPDGEAGDLGRMGHAFSLLQGRELWNLTIGLVGFGAVGREVARRLRAFGCRVMVCDPYVDAQLAALCDVELVPLEALVEASDIVSLHAAVTDETRGLIGRDELARMRRGTAIINTARAALVDEQALVDALASGHLGGAAVDVFAIEPPGPDHPLLTLESVIATPHVAGNTAEVAIHQGRIIVRDLERLLRGEAPVHVVNASALDHFDWSKPRPRPSAAALRSLSDQPPPAVSDLQRRRERPTASAHTRTATVGAVDGELAERMNDILARFVELISADDAMRAASAGAEVTLHFRTRDLGNQFHVRLDGSRAEGVMGAPATEAEVQLAMSADVLDGMFTGRVNAMEAAMDGRLSFTGDAAKAMTLQQLQAHLERLYQAARSEVGDPGDLSALAPRPRATRKVGTRGERAEELVRIVEELYGIHLITATGGNVSTRSEPGSEQLWITPSQMFKGELSADLLVGIDLDGKPLEDDARSPSSERLMHTAVYRVKPHAEAVIHCHAPNATILANADLPFSAISTEAAFFGNIPRIPFIMPGTVELADAIAAAIGDGWAVLMKNHGLLVAGRSLRRAADMAEVIERSAEIMLGCYAVGKEPPVLPNDIVAKLRRMGDLVA